MLRSSVQLPVDCFLRMSALDENREDAIAPTPIMLLERLQIGKLPAVLGADGVGYPLVAPFFGGLAHVEQQ
jgi:hypothetical protein